MNMKLRTNFAPMLFLIIALVSNTSLGIEPNSDAPIQTDKVMYSLMYSPDAKTLSIEATYFNTTDSTTYISRCGAADLPMLSLQKNVEDAWVNAYSYACPAVLAAPIEVAPGERFTYAIEIEHHHARDWWPRFTVTELPGLYRLVYDIRDAFDHTTMEFGEPLPLDTRVSNTFVIQE